MKSSATSNRSRSISRWNDRSSSTPCRSLCLVHCPTCVTASSQCTDESCTRCSTRVCGPTVRTPSAPRSSARSWARTTRTGTPRSTTPWCAWCRTSRCATRWSVVTGTSAAPAPTRAPPPCATPNADWLRWRWNCSIRSMKRPSTSSRTTTTPPSSRPSCRRASRIFSSTAPRASPWEWRPRSRPTTSAKSLTPRCTCWRTRTRPPMT